MKDMLKHPIFNSITKEIFNSKLNSKYAFVETITENIPINMKNNTIYGLDINKCYKNCLYY